MILDFRVSVLQLKLDFRLSLNGQFENFGQDTQYRLSFGDEKGMCHFSPYHPIRSRVELRKYWRSAPPIDNAGRYTLAVSPGVGSGRASQLKYCIG
jgi:hypothetical protein